MDDEILELINSYVDGSIKNADKLRLKELLDSDEQLMRDVKFLLRQRKLCLKDKSAVPHDLSQAVIRKLAGRGRHNIHSHKFGVRKHFNVAAIVLMLLVLGGVLLVIVGPFATGSGEMRNVAMRTKALPESDLHPIHATLNASIPIIEEIPQVGLCNYYLTLSTKDIARTERVLGQLIYEYNLLAGVNVSRQPGKTSYNIECSKSDFENLARNMAALWANADDVSLEFADYATRSKVNVAGITQHQLEKIVTASATSDKIKTAAAASVMNSLPSVPVTSFEKGYDVPANLFTLRPVLAGARNTGVNKNSDGNYVTVSIKIQNTN